MTASGVESRWHRFVRWVVLERGRSPKTLSGLELGAGVLAGILVWSAMYAQLSAFAPFGYWDKDPQTTLSEIAAFRATMLAVYAPLFTALTALSAISFVRGIRNDVRNFSRFGHWALALQPLFCLSPLVYFLCPLGGFSGLALAIIAAIEPVARGRNRGNLIVLPVSIISFLLGSAYWSAAMNFVVG